MSEEKTETGSSCIIACSCSLSKTPSPSTPNFVDGSKFATGERAEEGSERMGGREGVAGGSMLAISLPFPFFFVFRIQRLRNLSRIVGGGTGSYQ